MSKQHLGKECKICGRPYTLFRWNPGTGMRFKKTEICTTCAKLKNVCQSCVLDLEYHLPASVRDAALGTSVKIPTSDINRQYYVNRMDALLESAPDDASPELAGPSRAGRELLQRIARPDPDYKRNRPVVCSFYARGACTRGDACPYRHEMSGKAPTAAAPAALPQHATRLTIQKHAGAKPLVPPADPAIATLFFAGLPEIDADAFRAQLVESVPRLAPVHIAAVRQVARNAFVDFTSRVAAERAAEALAMKVLVDGKDVRVAWGRMSKPAVQHADAPADRSADPSADTHAVPERGDAT